MISKHFYNPSGKAAVQDTGTKYTIQVTKMLRPNELSTVVLGTTQFTVPPKSTRKTIRAICDGKCTERLGASTGVTATTVSFHMHGHGAAVRLRVVRGGTTELQPLADLDPFDVAQVSVFLFNEGCFFKKIGS